MIPFIWLWHSGSLRLGWGNIWEGHTVLLTSDDRNLKFLCGHRDDGVFSHTWCSPWWCWGGERWLGRCSLQTACGLLTVWACLSPDPQQLSPRPEPVFWFFSAGPWPGTPAGADPDCRDKHPRRQLCCSFVRRSVAYLRPPGRSHLCLTDPSMRAYLRFSPPSEHSWLSLSGRLATKVLRWASSSERHTSSSV